MYIYIIFLEFFEGLMIFEENLFGCVIFVGVILKGLIFCYFFDCLILFLFVDLIKKFFK